MRKRHVPIKALILDQAVISGVGNWVADESLYQAKLHPEQYCDEFSDKEIRRLHQAIKYVCQTAIDLLGDSDQFPHHWLFNYRWGKGKKQAASALPNGEKLAFITVGGRTSCYVPAVQKKTGHLVPGIKEEPLEDDGPPEKLKKGKAKRAQVHDTDEDEVKPKKSRRGNIKMEHLKKDKEDDEEGTRPRKKSKVKNEAAKVVQKIPRATSATETIGFKPAADPGRRRSARLSRA